MISIISIEKFLVSHKMSLLKLIFLLALLCFAHTTLNDPGKESKSFTRTNSRLNLFSDTDLESFLFSDETSKLEIICNNEKKIILKFRSLLKLRELLIKNCLFSEVKSDAFQRVENLFRLEISTEYNQQQTNKIEIKVPSLLLCNLLQLRYLTFTGYNIKNLDEIGCGRNSTCCSQLIQLQLNHNQISALQKKNLLYLSQLIQLNLSFNNIQQIEDAAFDNLRYLHWLYLDHNKVTQIGDIFRYLTELLELNLSFNNIDQIETGAFDNLRNLRWLHLHHNKLIQIDGIFRYLTQLQQLHLSNNEIISIHPEEFQNLQSVLGINLDNNQLNEIPNFISMPNLLSVTLRFNNIIGIRKNSFFNVSNLKYLNLKSNRIKLLRTVTFEYLPNIVEINLDSNQISEIQDGVFNTMKYLQTLIISNNKIRKMKLLFTSVQTELKQLHIEQNYLTRISGNEFDYAPKIEKLFLHQNKLKFLSPDAFQNLTKLQHLALHQNNLHRLHFWTIAPNLTEITFSDNQFECDCQNGELFPILFQQWTFIKRNINYLDLHETYCKGTTNLIINYNEQTCNKLMIHRIKKISTHVIRNKKERRDLFSEDQHNCPTQCHCFRNIIMPEVDERIMDCFNVSWQYPLPTSPGNTTKIFFDNNNNLESIVSSLLENSRLVHTLYMNNSGLRSVDKNMFKNVSNLKELHLQQNYLSNITGNEFKYTRAIEKLFLHQNQLDFISRDAFRNLRKLKVLTLHQNQLIHLNFEKIAPHLSKITFRENRFTCECKFTPNFQQWINVQHWIIKRPVKFPDLNKTFCNNNTILIMQFNSSKCNERNITRYLKAQVVQNIIVIVPTVIIAIVIIVIVILVYLYRVEMQVILYSRYGLRFFYNNNNDADNGKNYDAFISYANEDDEWVMETLAPQLKNYKLCLHQRDFLAGRFVVDSIVNAIETSCRTVIILTPNYVRSTWCKFEFDTAHIKSLEDRCSRLIVVFLEKVKEEEMDPTLRAYLKTNTYLDVDNNLFWSKLKYALPNLKNIQSPQLQEIEEENETFL